MWRVFSFEALMITRRQFVLGLGAAAAGSVGLGGYAFAVEPGFRLIVTEWDLPTPRWTYDRPLRMVLVSDIHACHPWMPPARIGAIVERANSLGGDIILVLGDFLSGIAEKFGAGQIAVHEFAPQLAGLQAPLGVHAILGNHDWWSDPEGVESGLKEAGIPLYRNRAV